MWLCNWLTLGTWVSTAKWLRSGIPVEVVSRNLGHATISITLDIYRHVLDSERRSRVVDLFAYVPSMPTGTVAALN